MSIDTSNVADVNTADSKQANQSKNNNNNHSNQGNNNHSQQNHGNSSHSGGGGSKPGHNPPPNSNPPPTGTPGKPTTTASAFVASLPVSNKNFASTLGPMIGQKYPKAKFAPPSDATRANIRTFLQTLSAYDATPTTDLQNQLQAIMAKLNLSAIRLQEDPNNSVIFYPNDVHAKNPIVCGGVLTWRFGKTAQFGSSDGIPQFFVFDPHSGQDGTINAVTTQYLAGAKALLSHAFNPNVDNNPNFKGNPITGANIKRFADPAHSDTTAFEPFVKFLYQIYPSAGCTVTHGMAGKPNFQLIASNDRVAKFLSDGSRDWCVMMTIALALQDFPINPNIVVIEGTVPGFVVKNGTTTPLMSQTNRAAPLRLNPHIGDNTDAIGHLANHAPGSFQMGQYLDNALFMELGPKFRDPKSHLMTLFVAAQKMASEWYMLYDPTIHDPWKLQQRFPDVYNNMNLYPKLFDPQFMLQYKQHGTNPFNSGKGAKAAALAMASENTASSDTVDQSTQDSVTECSTDVAPLLFSSNDTSTATQENQNTNTSSTSTPKPKL